MNTLDDLFREKLADHTVPPSRSSWDKIEAGLGVNSLVKDALSKKNSTIPWIRYAAMVALAAILWVITLTLQTPGSKLARKDATPADIKASDLTQHAAVVPPAVESKGNPQTSVKEIQSADVVASDRPLEEIVVAEQIVLEPETAEPVVAETTQAAPVRKPMVLVYTLAPLEPEVKTELVAEKDGALKKVVEFAASVKNSDASPVGELRTVKEDLFALDFKKIGTSKKQ